MKLLYVVLVFALLPATTFASNCDVAIYKTYMPRGNNQPYCDDQDLPASFAGHLPTLVDGLKAGGYTAKTYDQCANGDNTTATYLLVSQLGDCVQTGFLMSCKLYVALYNNKTKTYEYENTISKTGIGSATLFLSEAMNNGFPTCEE
jgi:hypothetical protein